MSLEYVLWFLVFITIFYMSYLLLETKKIRYKSRMNLNTAYYCACTFVLFYSIKGKISWFIDISYIALVSLFVYITLNIFLVNKINRLFPIPKKIAGSKNSPYFFRFTKNFVITKFSDILFQQLMIVWLLTILMSEGLDFNQIRLSFTVIFTIFHIPGFIKNRLYALFFILASFCGGIIIPWMIIYLKSGIIFSIMLHWSVYLAGRIIFGIYFARNTEE
jgi:hypothetical protein